MPRTAGTRKSCTGPARKVKRAKGNSDQRERRQQDRPAQAM
jgi:hypothetical protein